MRQKILIADDNRAITEVLKLNFELLGYEVQVASDGEEAQAKFKRFHPHIVILDVMMPKKNGYQVCQEIKADPDLAKVPIILLTAKNLKEDVYWGYDCGADAYVTKPYEPRQLELLVDQLIREAASGKRSTAWTGLPDASRVESEHRARLEAGAPTILLEMTFFTQACETFKAKYGQARFKDLLHRVAWLLYEIVRDGSTAGFVGQTERDSFYVSVHPDEAAGIRSRAASRIGDVIRSSYDPHDAEQGFVFWQSATGEAEEKVPLIAMEWKEVELEPE
jgi:DNA-binding response OmpR family regulator